MKLRNFLFEKKLSQTDLSVATRITIVTINNLVHRRFTPSLLNALKIHYESNGVVTLEEMLSEDDEVKFVEWRKNSKKRLEVKSV